MSAVISADEHSGKFDQLALERAVRSLCKAEIRRSPLSLERAKAWINQFEGAAERSLAWLILRHLIYRTGTQLESCLRQALKEAVTQFLKASPVGADADWKEALAGKLPGLHFFCGPPTVDGISKPGKSGEVVTRMVSRNYKVDKWYPHDVTVLDDDERYLVVDDGAYTGEQLISFLDGWRDDYAQRKVAIVVGLAHCHAVEELRKRHPHVPLFYGELLTEKNGLQSLSERWVADGQWSHESTTPLETYRSIIRRIGPFSGASAEGFGSLGLMVAFEHGIPDDSLQLLWDRSANWAPLIER
nr:hypothetical protein [uncultured Albidiferax sp.]